MAGASDKYFASYYLTIDVASMTESQRAHLFAHMLVDHVLGNYNAHIDAFLVRPAQDKVHDVDAAALEGGAIVSLHRAHAFRFIGKKDMMGRKSGLAQEASLTHDP